MTAAPVPGPQAAPPAPTIPVTAAVTFAVAPLDGPGTFSLRVAGTSHHQDELEAICGGRTKQGAKHECRALLVREPGSRYDPNAVMVQIDGKHIGYLARVDAIALRPTLTALWERGLVAAARAKVTGGWLRPRAEQRGKEAVGTFGVTVDVGLA